MKFLKFDKRIMILTIISLVVFCNMLILLSNVVNASTKFNCVVIEYDIPTVSDEISSNEAFIMTIPWGYKVDSFFLTSKESGLTQRLNTSEYQTSLSFYPDNIAVNFLPNYTKNIIILSSLIGQVVLVEIPNNTIINYIDCITSDTYYLYDIVLYKDMILCITTNITNDLFLLVLDLNFGLMHKFHIGNETEYCSQQLFIQDNYLISILSRDSSIADILLYNLLNINKEPLKVEIGVRIKDVAISTKKEIIIIAKDESLAFFDLYNYTLLNEYNISSTFGYETIDAMEYYNELIYLTMTLLPKGFFYDVYNRSEIQYKGYINPFITNPQSMIIDKYDNETGRIIYCSMFSLYLISYDLRVRAPTIYEEFGVDIQGALPIIILIGGAGLAVLYFQKNGKK